MIIIEVAVCDFLTVTQASWKRLIPQFLYCRQTLR